MKFTIKGILLITLAVLVAAGAAALTGAGAGAGASHGTTNRASQSPSLQQRHASYQRFVWRWDQQPK